MLNGGLVDWYSRLQDTVATSTLVAELYASYFVSTRVQYLRLLLGEIGCMAEGATKIHEDNQGVINVCKNRAGVDRTKHVEIKWFYLRELQESGAAVAVKVASADNVADAFTKPLSRTKIDHLLLKRYYAEE